MEPEIVEFDPRDEDIKIIRRWWRNNPAFSTIDEDCVFEDILKKDFTKIVGFMGFSYQFGANPKQLIVSTIVNGNVEKFLENSPINDFSDEIIAFFIQSIKAEEEKKEAHYDMTRKKIFVAINIILGRGKGE